MSKKKNVIKFIIFYCILFNIVSSISQTNENVPLNNIAQHISPKPISPIIVFPVNIENINYEKTKKFFSDLNVKKLEIFFDPNLNFVKELKLRGVPTTVIINKKGEEFARIIGSIDFKDKKFLKWLSSYD